MKSKSIKKLESLKLKPGHVITPEACKSIKGGGWYWCCAQNRWVNTGG